MSTASDVAKALTAEVEQLERKLTASEREASRLAEENSRMCDVIFESEQALKAAQEKIEELAVKLAEFQAREGKAAA